MPNDSLRSLAKVLHEKLESASSLTGEDRESLRRLASDINEILAQPGASGGAAPQGLLDRIREDATRFEATHPDLTSILMRVSKALGDMGI